MYEAGVGGFPKDEEMGRMWLELAASPKYGHASAQFALGSMLLLGDEGSKLGKDVGKGLQLIRTSAAQGHAGAQYELGALSLSGVAPGGAAAAFGWFSQAAEQGYTMGAYHVAQMLRDGNGVDADLAAARRWFALAAEPQAWGRTKAAADLAALDAASPWGARAGGAVKAATLLVLAAGYALSTRMGALLGRLGGK